MPSIPSNNSAIHVWFRTAALYGTLRVPQQCLMADFLLWLTQCVSNPFQFSCLIWRKFGFCGHLISSSTWEISLDHNFLKTVESYRLTVLLLDLKLCKFLLIRIKWCLIPLNWGKDLYKVFFKSWQRISRKINVNILTLLDLTNKSCTRAQSILLKAGTLVHEV